MEIYFKYEIWPDDFEYLQNNFEDVCYMKRVDIESVEYYSEVNVNSEDLIIYRPWWINKTFELFLEDMLIRWYKLYYDKLDNKYYLTF